MQELAAAPTVLAPILSEPVGPGAGTSLGFASSLAGLAFLGAAAADSLNSRRRFVRLALAGNVLNHAAHLSNVVRGLSPALFGAGVGSGGMIAI